MANPSQAGEAGTTANRPQTGPSSTPFRRPDPEPSSAKSSASSSAPSGADLGKTAKDAADAIKGQASDLARNVGQELTRTGENQKARGAEALHQFANAIDGAAGELEKQSPVLAGAVHEAARRVDELSTSLASRDVNDLVDQAAKFARANPALFIGGSVAAGFAVARFLMSGGRRASRPTARPSADPYQI